MRILCVSHSQKLGGAERVLSEAVGALVQSGHDVWVTLPSKGELESVLVSAGATCLHVSYPWWVHNAAASFGALRRARKLASHFRGCMRMVSVARDLKPDLVMSNTLTVAVGAIAARSVNAPHIWFVHEYGLRDHNLRFDFGSRASFWLMSKLSQVIVSNSKSIEAFLREHIPSWQIRLLHYAVVVPERSDTAELHGSFNLLVVGQIARSKRQHDVIKAVKLLRSRGRYVRLTIIGSEHDQEYSASLRALIQHSGVGDLVDILPFQECVSTYINAADAVVVASDSEAFGRITVEAMKLGIAVVGAASAGTAEIIKDDVNGLVYVPGDVIGLSSKIERLYDQPGERARLARAGRLYAASKFNAVNYRANLDAIVAEAVAR